MRHISGFQCIDCGKEHLLSAAKYTCPACAGNLQVVYDYKAIRRRLSRVNLAADRDPSLRRWLDLLPVSHRRWAAGPPPGGTPLYAAPQAASALGLARARETGERIGLRHGRWDRRLRGHQQGPAGCL